MNNTTLIYISLVLSTFSTAFAQENSSSSDTNDKHAYATHENYLSFAQELAKESDNFIEPKLAEIRGQKSNFEVCEADLILFQKRYIDWFLDPDHQKAIQSLYDELSQKSIAINQRLIALGTEEVNVNPTDAQKTTVPVTLEKIKSYLRDLNDRLKGASEEKLAATKRSQEHPELNALFIAHSQIKVALDMMSTTLNASLKQTNSTFKLNLVEFQRRFELSLVINNSNDVNDVVTIDLLNETSHQIMISEKEKWQALAEKVVDGYSVDGLRRYIQMQKTLREPDCMNDNFKKFSPKPSGVPFVKYEDAAADHSNETYVSWLQKHVADDLPVSADQCMEALDKLQTLGLTHHTWNLGDHQWICSARRTITIDSSLKYNACIIREAILQTGQEDSLIDRCPR